MKPLILQDRLEKLDTITLLHGPHRSFKEGACALEAAAWLAGEEHSDSPSCVCPVIALILRRANDRMGFGAEADERRNRVLRPLLPVIIGTRRTRAAENLRAYMATDWSLRNAIPRLLRCTSFVKWADELEKLAPIVDKSSFIAALNMSADCLDAAWRKRDEAWARLRAHWHDAAADIAAVAADAAAIAAAIAVAADAAAIAAAADAAAIAADAAAIAVVAADAAADAADVAADAAADAAAAAAIVAAADAAIADFKRIYDVTVAAHAAGKTYSACCAEALEIANEAISPRIGLQFRALRDELDAEFAELVKRLCGVAE